MNAAPCFFFEAAFGKMSTLLGSLKTPLLYTQVLRVGTESEAVTSLKNWMVNFIVMVMDRPTSDTGSNRMHKSLISVRVV